jgi:glycosyltransferase involved in cell wall biosynthesis
MNDEPYISSPSSLIPYPSSLIPNCQPKVLRYHDTGCPRVSIILIDWGVRESFHSLHYLNRQSVDRRDYELIWVEFYQREPEDLHRMVSASPGGYPLLDKWIVLGYPGDYVYHKHRMYNVGLLAAQGDICVICDSDAVFSPIFLERLLQTFAEKPNSVVHLDEVRNTNPAFYPFNYPSIQEIVEKGSINWQGHVTLGLDNSPDKIHHANYGACLAAWRKDLRAIGGADEDLDYLGYVCGPYELTFRLVNYGRSEHWLTDEFLYHTWHPNQYGGNTDYQGPHDGAHLSLLALDARASRRIGPCLPCPFRRHFGKNKHLPEERLREILRHPPEPFWQHGEQPAQPGDRVYWIERDYYGFDVFFYRGRWFALRAGSGLLDPQKLLRNDYREIWRASNQLTLRSRLPLDPQRQEKIRTTGGKKKGWWSKLQSQPWYRWPGRLFRHVRDLA